MSIASLQIASPSNGQHFPGTGAVPMSGSVLPPGPAGLFFKWYSSLSTDPLGTTTDFTASLGNGSHIVTFTAKDVLGDSKADLPSVQRAGFAGGPPIAQAPCIIHVFLANMIFPASDGATLSKAASTLIAQAPASWTLPEYEAVNHLQYRWRFTPFGPPDGRPSANFVPSGSPLQFHSIETTDPPDTLPRLIYNGPLPDAMGTGNYTITLRVEDTLDNSIGHEVSHSIVVNP